MARVNPMDGAIRLVVKEYTTLKTAADKSNAVPLGQELLSTREAASRFKQMSEEQRQGMIDTMGIDKVMEIVRSIKK